MNIFQALREDHKKQRQLANALVRTSGDTKERHELFGRLSAELKSHAIAEERHFYVPLIEADETQEMARHGVAEHHEMDELMEKLESIDPSSPAWLATAKELRELIHHHLDDEEKDFFPQAGDVLNPQEKTSLGGEFQEEKEEALHEVQ
ncbi:hemerythrin domain-containing protein [Teredinibacter turnerae]|uniref:hemerythrin domain-containing protein n=1 Tax=Teredinibacter turnerae TaxID=2426 RepID=UPI000404F904|nr:hemerythrin domain-containing protein [Teredinibacter turnerae]